MIKDILGYRIKKKPSNTELHYLGKFYFYNNVVYQIVRINIMEDECFLYVVKISDKFPTKVKKIILDLNTFKDFKVFENKPKINKKSFKYNYCYFDNRIMKEKFNILLKLYKLGYENYNANTAFSFHSNNYTIIINGLLSTCNDEEFADEMKNKKLRNLFHIFND